MYVYIHTYAHTFMPAHTHKQAIYACSNTYTILTKIYIHAHLQ